MRKIPSLSFAAILFVWSTVLLAQAPPSRSAAQLPNGPGKEITQKVCGATCHGPDIIMGSGRTRDQWTGVVNSMIARGAKATDAETFQIAQYLSSHFGPEYSPPVVTASARMPIAQGPGTGANPGRGPGPLGSGAADSHVVDRAGADRGKNLYIAQCITCHGNKARGGNPSLPANQQGPDLVRSVVVLHDRYGNELSKLFAKGHPMQSGQLSSSLTTSQVADLAHFLHQRVFFTLRGGPDLEIQNVLTGDPKAGQTYFNGEGRCAGCHSAKGDLAGIGKKYDPPTLQSKFLFPRTVGFGRPGSAAITTTKKVTVTVTEPDGKITEGVLDTLDDFNVSLRDAEGQYHSFAIAPALKVVKHDPYSAHVELLDRYTDKNMHDIVAYLESLK